jgi:hypothetical protein
LTANHSDRERGGIELMEETFHALRVAPLVAFGWYYAGALPFIVGLLYFWADMSRSPFAAMHDSEAALGVGLLFIWCKICQAMFAQHLRASVARDVPRLDWRRIGSIALSQAIVQPSKLFVLPVSAVITLPFGWACAFYGHATAIGADDGVRSFLKRVSRQTKLWPRQNHFALALITLLAFFIFVNMAVTLILLPHLAKMLTGIETNFTRSPVSIFNTTFLAVTAALTYLCCDPLLKAFYVLRCFYAESIRSGEDLRSAIRTMLPAKALVAALCLCAISLGAALDARADASPPPPSARAAELDQAISRTVEHAEFTWRMPRLQRESAVERRHPFLGKVRQWLADRLRSLGRYMKTFINWLERQFDRSLPADSGAHFSGWSRISRALLWSLVGIATAVLLFFAWRVIRDRRRGPREMIARPISAARVDVSDESITADLLPEDEWLTLAAQLVEQRQFRLALRALFLAGLAHLGRQGVITVAKFKSNRDYVLELRRRAADRPTLQGAFHRTVTIVERVWYGQHDATADSITEFNTALKEIRAC